MNQPDDQRVRSWFHAVREEDERSERVEVRWSPLELWLVIGRFSDQNVVICQQPTVGDVKRLCEALRIPFPEDVLL